MQNLNQLLKLLLDNHFDFVLVGGFAGVVHGSSQVTKDLDICAFLSPDNILKLRDALKDLHPVHRMNPSAPISFLDHPQDLTGINNIYLRTDWGILDVISSVTAVGDFQRIKEHAVQIHLFGHQCKVISIEDLITVKEALGRNKDKIVAAELKLIRQRNGDKS